MVLKIIRWILGYIVFKIEPEDSQFFVNLVSKSKINIWDIKKINRILYAKINSKEYVDLSTLLERNDIELDIVEKIGLPFFYKEHKDRKGIILGFFLFFAILNFLSLFVWKINVIGNKILDSKAIVDCCKINGVSNGKLKKSIDAQVVAQNIMNQISEISWISINLDGCVANVQINERISKSEDEDKKISNIVSSCDAQIERMETFSGTPLVNPGDVVFENQLLVGAYCKNNDGSVKDIYAKANILAKVYEEVSEFEKFEQNLEIKKGNEKKIFILKIFGNSFKINFWEHPENNEKKEEYENNLNIFGLKIPISFVTEKYFKVKNAKIFLSKEEAIERAKKSAYEKLDLKKIDLIDCKESYQENSDGILFKIQFSYLKNIAKYAD